MKKVTTDTLIRDLSTVVHDAEALLEATAGQTGESIAALRDRAEESLRNARERMKDAGIEVRDRASAAVHSTDVYVHENPWTAIAVAAGIGFLLGALSRRR